MEVRLRLRSARRALSALGLVLTVAGATPATAAAQTVESDRAAIERAVMELRQLIDEQRRLLDQQARIIEAQGQDLAALRRQVDRAGAVGASALAPAPGAPSPAPPTTLAATQPAPGAPGVQIPDLPAAVVSVGDFPGSIGIPGTDVAFRIGGQGRLMMVHTMAPLGTDDRFVTSSIPVEGTKVSGDGKRVNYSATASRANLDLRTEGPRGPLRTFFESDFAGDGGDGHTLRLRHAFLQTSRWLGGQTWSTFSDREAEPTGIDFEGLNAISMFRQPQIRYTHPIRRTLDLALALENPAPDLTGASGVSVTPDFIARLRWNPGSELLLGTSHIQTAVLVRTLRGEVQDRPDLALSTGGLGGNVSGVVIPLWDRDDRVKFAANFGWGIGRYITDLEEAGGQDGVYDPATETLHALRVSSGYLGYERMWRPTIASSFTFGLVNVENVDIQADDALRRTQRATVNVTWNPMTNASLVVELLAGRRVNKDGKRGVSSQVQAGWLYRF